MNSLVSVIIPVYNASDKIEKCVESLIFGEYSNIEVILIDDCSQDNSWEVCNILTRKYKNVYSYKNERNSGVSFTRNRGISVASGEYTVFVDSDDWVSKKYILRLVETAANHPDTMVFCGMYFIDERKKYKKKYIWDDSGSHEIILPNEKYFSLVGKFYIQSPCNKIFISSIIRNNNLKFNVSQSMGEDFQFVLDYMQCLKSEYCIVLNEPLYYYVRYSDTSLMSQFGISEKNHEFIKRLNQLYKIIGIDSDDVNNSYKRMLDHTLNSYVYNICHNKTIDKQEKLSLIEYVMGDNKARKYYKEQSFYIRKESIYRFKENVFKLPLKIRNKYCNIRNKRVIRKNKKLLKNNNFSVISQNCIGGVIYNDFGMQFLSPTVNLYFKANDFVKFVRNLKYYIDMDIKIVWDEEYPIGVLDDIYVHFMHYSTCSEAREAWERRKRRINYDKILIISTDMEGFDDNTFNEWKKINYPKILLSSKYRNVDNCIFFKNYRKLSSVPDLIPRREFYKNEAIVNMINSL